MLVFQGSGCPDLAVLRRDQNRSRTAFTVCGIHSYQAAEARTCVRRQNLSPQYSTNINAPRQGDHLTAHSRRQVSHYVHQYTAQHMQIGRSSWASSLRQTEAFEQVLESHESVLCCVVFCLTRVRSGYLTQRTCTAISPICGIMIVESARGKKLLRWRFPILRQTASKLRILRDTYAARFSKQYTDGWYKRVCKLK